MQELVGNCKKCNKQIYCFDGFLNGTVLADQTLLCMDCYEEDQDLTTSRDKEDH